MSQQAIEDILCGWYPVRKEVQKLEFWVIWVILLVLVVETVRPLVTEHGQLTSAENSIWHHTDELFFSSRVSIQFYLPLSVASRLLAYAIDFAHARNTNKTSEKSIYVVLGLPLWLLLHHCGVLFSHIVIASVENPKTWLGKMLVLFSLQSTHNTWTKKHSTVLYWFNVIFGAVSAMVGNVMEPGHATRDHLLLALTLMTSYCGVAFLALESWHKGQPRGGDPRWWTKSCRHLYFCSTENLAGIPRSIEVA